ncbi:MAG: hypothetical protein PHF00_04360 [Elusimicrobia bacterium]|nr:hypothetical protein [Elusimicrobiota bacterium]
MNTWNLLALLLLLPGPARASSGTVRLALLEETQTHCYARLIGPIQKLADPARPRPALIQEVLMLPAYYNGGDCRFRIPRTDFPSANVAAAVLETETETALIFPPAPSFLDELARLARDPETFDNGWSPRISTRTMPVAVTQTLAGESLVSALLDPQAGEGAQWHNSIVLLYRLRWEDQDITVAVVGKVFGGLARLATALSRENASAPKIIGVSRGGIFGKPGSDLRGAELGDALAGLGLRYCAVGEDELYRWGELQSYRSRRPGGIQFLSANLALSSAPATTLLPGHALFSAGGLRVAIIGLTPPSAARYLAQAGLRGATIADPMVAVSSEIAKVRGRTDLVVVLGRPEGLPTRQLHGADLIIAEDAGDTENVTRSAEAGASQIDRRAFEPPLWTMRSFISSLDILESDVEPRPESRDVRLRERHVLLDQSLPLAPQLPEFEPENFGITVSTEPGLIPPVNRIFPVPARSWGVSAAEFWSLVASLLREDTGAELVLLETRPLPVKVLASMEAREGVVRSWLWEDDALATVRLKGAEISRTLAASRRRAALAARAERPAGTIVAAGGLGEGDAIHGLPIDKDVVYNVTTTRALAAAQGWEIDPNGVSGELREAALRLLRARRGSPAEAYAPWMQGRPAAERGLWRINFRDVSLNIQNTKVARGDAFDAVPNPRVQGSDELLIGGDFKTDADYLRGAYKWSNTLELEYARSRLRPRDQPAVTNIAANRMTFLTAGTRRAGGVGADWLARSWGPSLGFQYDGQLEETPPLKRRQIYSAFPGVEFYDGTFVRSLRAGANIKRDFSLDPPNTQYGLRAQAVVSKAVGPGPASLNGEVWANYFFLMRRDRPDDLRWEGDANLKLRVPIRKNFNVSPFIDFYFFALKTRPIWGYSAMTGISVGFSRLWKPQYEPF